MNPKQYEFLAQDRIAEVGRNVAGDQRIARARGDARTAISAGERRGWSARARLPRSLRLSRMIARLVGG